MAESRTILIVADDPTLLTTIKKQLAAVGLVGLAARTADEALAQLQKTQFDAVWLHHYLQGEKTGVDVITAMRADERLKAIPVFVVSNVADEGKKRAYAQLGATKYYPKERFRFEQVVSDIQDFLDSGGPERPVVLIVEDEEPMQRALAISLSRAGLTPLKANNGEEGLTLARERHPALILLDILMPRLDGLNMLKKLRQDSWGKSVPTIMLTNIADPAQESAAKELGALAYLVKSDWKISDIIQKVKENLPATADAN